MPSSGVMYFRRWIEVGPCRTTWNPLTQVYSVTLTLRRLTHQTALVRSFQHILRMDLILERRHRRRCHVAEYKHEPIRGHRRRAEHRRCRAVWE